MVYQLTVHMHVCICMDVHVQGNNTCVHAWCCLNYSLIDYSDFGVSVKGVHAEQ